MIKHYLNVSKFKMDRDWWHSLGMLIFYYFLLLFALACIGHVRANAAEDSYSDYSTVLYNDSLIYYTNSNVYLSTDNGNRYIVFSGPFYTKDKSDSITYIDHALTYFYTNSFLILKGTVGVSGGLYQLYSDTSTMGYTPSNSFVPYSTVPYFRGMYFFGSDNSGVSRLYYIGIDDNSYFSFYSITNRAYVSVVNSGHYFYYDDENSSWNAISPQVLRVGKIIDIFGNIFAASDTYIPFELYQREGSGAGDDPLPTITPSPSPTPLPDLPLSSDFPQFNNYLDLANYFSNYNCDIFITSTSFNLTPSAVLVGVGLSSPSYDSSVTFYGDRFYVFNLSTDKNIFTKYYYDNGEGRSVTVRLYNPTYRNFDMSFSRYFDHRFVADWPFMEDVTLPSPTPSPIPSPTLSPTPSPLPLPTNSPQTPIQDPNNNLPFGSPENLPNWKDINVPYFDFDNQYFQMQFSDSASMLVDTVGSADPSFLGLLNVFPDEFLNLLWFMVGIGIAGVVIKIIKE